MKRLLIKSVLTALLLAVVLCAGFTKTVSAEDDGTADTTGAADAVKAVYTAEDLLYRVGIPLVRSLPLSELPGWVDWDLVELMLWELLGNAAAHSGDRPIRLSAKSSGPDRLLISIENSSPTDLPEDLYRQHSLPPETASGTLGLGLSVVRMGAAAHGGSLLLSQGPGGSIRALLSLTLAREPDKPRLNSFPVDRSAFPTPLVFLSSVLPAEDYDLRDLL